jgi:hypothetical protein
MKININELGGKALDWAVTKAMGYDHEVTSPNWGMHGWATKWEQGGPIIERERIATWGDGDLYWEAECGWAWAKGPTPLIAAMRCYATLKLGDEVEVPEELSA